MYIQKYTASSQTAFIVEICDDNKCQERHTEEWAVDCGRTLALSTSVSMLWLALNIFCASCWGLRGVHTRDFNFTREPKCTDNSHKTHQHTHLLAKLFPALEEVVWGHLSRLEELVDGDRQLERQVLQSSAISEHTHTPCRSTHLVCSCLDRIDLSCFYLFPPLLRL